MFFAVLSWIFALIGGFVTGAIIIVFIKLKRVRIHIFKTANQKKELISSDKTDRIDAVVNGYFAQYKKANRFTVFKKVVGISVKTDQKYLYMYGDIIRSVATVYNESSKNPLLEFTVRNLFDFINSVSFDVEGLIDSLDMPMLKNLDISSFYGVYNFSKRVSGGAVAKSAKKVIKPIAKIKNFVRFINPVTFIKGVIDAVFTASLTRDVMFAVAEIIAWEFAVFYSKNNLEKQKEVA